MTHDDELMTVTLSTCTEEDARGVLAYLGADSPTTSDDVHPTVWTAEVSASDTPDHRPGALKGSVAVTVQGAPHDVEALRTKLDQVYTVEDAGSASGDQELDTQFTLTSG
ncbi:hypothetical protein ABZY90_01180 [Streptomyces sp. NPDC006422]|uniref:hypothetical protein n=1 Tax=unclassified Streptomyces TaxID=2593676 RepID=UPI00339DB4F7